MPTDPTDRDPRVDPQPGDVTEGAHGLTFRVVDRTAASVWFVSPRDGDIVARWSTSQWQAYAAGDTVLEVADAR